jgi:hypothetical protein
VSEQGYELRAQDDGKLPTILEHATLDRQSIGDIASGRKPLTVVFELIFGRELDREGVTQPIKLKLIRYIIGTCG